MTIVSKRRFGFTTSGVYKLREPHVFQYLSERATFWIAIVSVFAFVTGNMIGQHGWHVFWKSVLGEGTDNMIVFTGTVPPVAQIPDYDRWAKLGGNVRTDTFRQVPKDLLIPLPTYIHHGTDISGDQQLRRVYFVEHLGTYDNGRGLGSHVGIDISLPQGTPIQSIANGVVTKVGYDGGGYGNYVVIKHPFVPDVRFSGVKSTIYSIYAHLSAVQTSEGTVVQKGDTIALSGQTGNATAPHLHFQMDNDDAPFHPYWPFTAAEQRTAGLSFVQAIDTGLDRSNGVAYTLDPMLVVQQFENYSGPVIAHAAASSSSPVSLANSIAARKALRLAKLTASKPTLVAYNDAAPTPVPAPAPVSSSSASSSSVTPVVQAAAPVDAQIAAVRVTHSGKFSQVRQWQEITLTLLDADNNVIKHPTGDAKFYVTVPFGTADVENGIVTLGQFHDGVYRGVKVRPIGAKTVLLQVQPIGTMSPPLVYAHQ